MKIKHLPTILTLPLIILLLCTYFTVLNIENNNNTPEIRNIVKYLNNKEDLNQDYLNQKEIIHLKDVKDLFSLMKIVLISSITLFITSSIFLIKKKEFIPALKKGALLTLIIIFLILISSTFFFTTFFTLFHKISFTNDLWIMYPSEDILIHFFPDSFFKNNLLTILIPSLAISIIILISTYWLCNPKFCTFSRKPNKKN